MRPKLTLIILIKGSAACFSLFVAACCHNGWSDGAADSLFVSTLSSPVIAVEPRILGGKIRKKGPRKGPPPPAAVSQCEAIINVEFYNQQFN